MNPKHSKPSHVDQSEHVTTNPTDVGAGGGSAPLGHSDQDSRTWTTTDSPAGKRSAEPVRKPQADDATRHETHSKPANIHVKNDEPGEKMGSEHQDPGATHDAGRKHEHRNDF